jgi:hypothetical protein
MSNSLAIAAVTATLRNLLQQGLTADLPDASVTTKPLDKARNSNDSGNQINLFLYQAEPSAAWRNLDMPRQVKPGETGHPPLGLNLYYLITAYGQNDDDTFSHRLLGRAMSILHDHPLLSAPEIKAATETELPESDLHEQMEGVRITSQPLSFDDMSKLWTGFQIQYRLSTTYQASVVLIESICPAKTPLPVLTRGPDDEGVAAQADLAPPFPTLESVGLPNNQPSARLGDVLTLSGYHLDGDSVVVRFINRRLTEHIEITPLPGGTATEITVQLPDEPADWPAGFYTLAAVVSRAGQPDRTTNELPLSLAPGIVDITPNPAARDGSGNVTLTMTCNPEVRPEQRAALLLGNREILAGAHPAQTNTLQFLVTDTPPGEHSVRLRVDGVDSMLVDRTVTPPVFDETQKVTIT